jgi:SAM-dependent methyltransferase
MLPRSASARRKTCILRTSRFLWVMDIDFGRTASDYARYRAGFPDRFFERLFAAGWVKAGDRVLDLGTGTGNVARGLALRDCIVTAVDRSQPLLEQAAILDREAGVQIRYLLASAEDTGLPAHSFNAITAGQCWHWFDKQRAGREIMRLLKPGGTLILAHFGRLPLPGSVVEATENLIREHNPDWYGGVIQRRGVNRDICIQPGWFDDLSRSGFIELESFTFDISMPYAHEAWLGRIRASSGAGASLPPDQVERFNDALRQLLKTRFPDEPLQIPQRVFALMGRAPAMPS